MPFCDECGKESNSVAVYEDEEGYLNDLCRKCGQGKTKKEDKVSSENEAEEDSAWESTSSSSSSEDEELCSENDDEIVPEEEDDEEDIVVVDDTINLPGREELKSQERRLRIQRLIRKEGYVINARYLASWFDQNVELSNAMDGKAKFLSSELSAVCEMFMSTSIRLKPICWNIIASFLVPDKPPRHLTGNESEQTKAKILSNVRFYEINWEPIRTMKNVLFTDNIVYYFDAGNKSVSLHMKDGLVRKTTIALPTSNSFSFANGPDELARQDFRTGYSCGRDAMDTFSKYPPLLCRAVAHLVLSEKEDDGQVVNAVNQVQAGHKTMAILHLCSLVFRKYLQRLLPKSTNNMHRDYRFFGKKKRENKFQIRVHLHLPIPGTVCFNVDPVQGDHATVHDIFKTIQHDMRVYNIPLPFEMTENGWIAWESMTHTCFKKHWRCRVVSKYETDDYSKWNPFEKTTKVWQGRDISFYFSEDPPVSTVSIGNLNGWKYGGTETVYTSPETKLGDVFVRNVALRNWPHPDEILDIPIDTPIHELKTRNFSLKTKPFRMSNRIVCIDKEEYDKKVLNDLKQFVKRFENVAMEVISEEEEFGTHHVYIREPDNKFLALFLLYLELGVNGKNDNIYFTEHHENFDRFKTYLGDLKWNHVDKRQYTCSPGFFKTIIEGDNAFKWLVEHFTKYLSELNNLFQVIPYQFGEGGNDKVVTYYTYLRQSFNKTSKLPRRNKPSYPKVFQLRTHRLHRREEYAGKTIYAVPFYTQVSDNHGHSYAFDKIPKMRLDSKTKKCFPDKLEICLCGDSTDTTRGNGWMVLDFRNNKFRLNGSKVTWAKCERLVKFLIKKKKRFPDCDLMGCFQAESLQKLPVAPLRSTAYFKYGVTKENFIFASMHGFRGGEGLYSYKVDGTIRALEFGCIPPSIDKHAFPTLALSRCLLKQAMREWKPEEFKSFMSNNARIRRERKKRKEVGGESITNEVEMNLEEFAKKWFGSRHPPEEEDVVIVRTLSGQEVIDAEFRNATIIQVE